MDVLVWTVVAIAFGWFVLGRAARNSDNLKGERPTAVPPNLAEKNLDGHSLGLESEEATEVKRARAAAKRVEDEQKAAQVAHDREQQEIRAKIEKARQIVKEAKLDGALPSLWEMVRYWPSWSNLPSDRWTAPEGISAIGGAKGEGAESTSWTWRGMQFELTHMKQHNYTPDDDYNPADLSLAVNGGTVLAARCDWRYTDYGSDLRYVDIQALTVGPWMAEIVELEAFLRAASSDSLRRALADLDREKAARINL